MQQPAALMAQGPTGQSFAQVRSRGNQVISAAGALSDPAGNQATAGFTRAAEAAQADQRTLQYGAQQAAFNAASQQAQAQGLLTGHLARARTLCCGPT